MDASPSWSHCSSCKGDIDFGQTYYVCSVSTCRRKGSDFRFCSVECWDAHVPTLRHRDAWAEEERAPRRAEAERATRAEAPAPRPAAAAPAPPAPRAPAAADDAAREILVVVSKVKAYVRARSGMNTSDALAEVLSDWVRSLCDEAIRNAGRDGRKTVLDRDLRPPR